VSGANLALKNQINRHRIFQRLQPCGGKKGAIKKNSRLECLGSKKNEIVEGISYFTKKRETSASRSGKGGNVMNRGADLGAAREKSDGNCGI